MAAFVVRDEKGLAPGNTSLYTDTPIVVPTGKLCAPNLCVVVASSLSVTDVDHQCVHHKNLHLLRSVCVDDLQLAGPDSNHRRGW